MKQLNGSGIASCDEGVAIDRWLLIHEVKAGIFCNALRLCRIFGINLCILYIFCMAIQFLDLAVRQAGVMVFEEL